MPNGINLLFTILIWIFLLIVLLSNRTSKVNQWCFISGMIFSLGVFKEYFFFDWLPYARNPIGALLSPFGETTYSVMTAVLYLLAMPTAFIFSFYFSDSKVLSSECYNRIKWLIPPLAALFALIYHPEQFRYYQLNDLTFWTAISVYNLVYGIAATLIMTRTVMMECNPVWKRQKRRVAILILPLIWYWLITIFVIHALNIKSLFELWRGNLAILFVLICYYLVMAFREGIMGIKLETVHYNWDSEVKLVQQGAQYVTHFLKNELIKIEWSANNLANKTDSAEELKIISRSVDRLKDFIRKNQFYSRDICLNCSFCSLYDLVESCAEDAQKRISRDITIENHCAEGIQIYCDPLHIGEVLNNLLNNAADAIKGSGVIVINCSSSKKGHYMLSVEDNGIGMDKETLQNLFKPYYSGKGGDEHLGLGLFYCYRVMQKHNGSIDVTSEYGSGTAFHLHFPKQRGGAEQKCQT